MASFAENGAYFQAQLVRGEKKLDAFGLHAGGPVPDDRALSSRYHIDVSRMVRIVRYVFGWFVYCIFSPAQVVTYARHGYVIIVIRRCR